MANGGPNTNAAQFCVTLGDRSYLDGDYNVFGEVVEGLDVVRKIVQGDVVESVRILRIGAKAEAFHPTSESFRALVHVAEQRVTEYQAKKTTAERNWIAQNYPKASGPTGGVLTETLVAGRPNPNGVVRKAVYRGKELRYMAQVIGRSGPDLDVVSFASGDTGAPGVFDQPKEFSLEAGKTKINPGLDSVLAHMTPGERRVVIVPALLGYGKGGFYPKEIPGEKRFIISPNALLVYEVEVLDHE